MQLNFCKEYVFDLVFTCMLVSLPQHNLALSAILSALKIYSVYIFNALSISIYMARAIWTPALITCTFQKIEIWWEEEAEYQRDKGWWLKAGEGEMNDGAEETT